MRQLIFPNLRRKLILDLFLQEDRPIIVHTYLKPNLLKALLAFAATLLLWSCAPGEEKQNMQASHLAKAPKEDTPKLSPEEFQKHHDLAERFVKTHFLRGRFNGSILVAKNGVPVYERYIGYRDLRTKDSLTAETPLQIASTSKPFTAAAILKLVQYGG
jgi:CubicO group peptidase (beta-lactamase class C family)